MNCQCGLNHVGVSCFATGKLTGLSIIEAAFYELKSACPRCVGYGKQERWYEGRDGDYSVEITCEKCLGTGYNPGTAEQRAIVELCNALHVEPKRTEIRTYGQRLRAAREKIGLGWRALAEKIAKDYKVRLFGWELVDLEKSKVLTRGRENRPTQSEEAVTQWLFEVEKKQ